MCDEHKNRVHKRFTISAKQITNNKTAAESAAVATTTTVSQHIKTPLESMSSSSFEREREELFPMCRTRYNQNYITEWKGTHDSNINENSEQCERKHKRCIVTGAGAAV